MLKDDFCIVGIGQGGCKMAKEFYDNQYRTFFINTSYDDLSQLRVGDDYSYHVPSAKGCAKKREVALEYARNYYNQMCCKLLDTHPTAKIFTIHYTLGGGTGGGLSNLFMGTLRNELIKRKKEDWTIIAVVAKPRSYESYQIQNNAIESYQELIKLEEKGIVTQYYVIDNDSRDSLDEINQEHYILFDRWVVGEGANNVSNVEESERLDLFKNRGQAMIFTFDSIDINTFKAECIVAYDKSIYCKPSRRPNAVGYALNTAIKEREAVPVIESVVGLFPNSHMTPTDVSNVVLVAGCEVNKDIVNDMKNLANTKAISINKVSVNDEVDDISVIGINRNNKKPKSNENEMLSIDDILDFFN